MYPISLSKENTNKKENFGMSYTIPNSIKDNYMNALLLDPQVEYKVFKKWYKYKIIKKEVLVSQVSLFFEVMFMIAIATGYVDLDEKLKKSIKDSTIIGYREFLVKEESNFEIAIISSKLGGEIEIQQLLFVLKQKGTRIIYLTNEENKEEIIACFDLGIYDIVLDPIDDEKIEYVLKNPQSLSTPLISKLYVKYKNDEDIGDNKKSSLKDFLKKNEETKIVEKVVEVPVKVPVIVQKTVTKTIKQQVLTF